MAELKWTNWLAGYGTFSDTDRGRYWIKESSRIFAAFRYEAGVTISKEITLNIGNFGPIMDAKRACQDHYDLTSHKLSLHGEAIAQVAEGKLQPVDDDLLKWSTLDTFTWFSDRGEYRLIRGTNVECFNVYVKNERTLFNLIASPKTLHDAKQAAQYHYDATKRTVPAVKQEPEPAAPVEGLETVRYEIIETLPSGSIRWQCTEHKLSANSIAVNNEHPSVVNALVHRSQAEAIIAAERAENDEAYELGKRDGYSEAAQEIDLKTGGDGEYRYCTDHDPERHTPDPASMIQRIVERFETLNTLESVSEINEWKERAEKAEKALEFISGIGFVAAKDAPAHHDEAVKVARAALTKNGDANGST